jgi:hypothetical protein
MSAGERVTWETCPNCGLSAAVGWRDGVLVIVDCPGGCNVTATDFAWQGPRRRKFPPPMAPQTIASRTSASRA